MGPVDVWNNSFFREFDEFLLVANKGLLTFIDSTFHWLPEFEKFEHPSVRPLGIFCNDRTIATDKLKAVRRIFLSWLNYPACYGVSQKTCRSLLASWPPIRQFNLPTRSPLTTKHRVFSISGWRLNDSMYRTGTSGVSWVRRGEMVWLLYFSTNVSFNGAVINVSYYSVRCKEHFNSSYSSENSSRHSLSCLPKRSQKSLRIRANPRFLRRC